jgi:hypothetical protein
VWCLDSITSGCTLHSGLVVARESDSYSLVESFVVHLPFVGRAGPCYYRKHTLSVFSLVISLELNNIRHSLPKLELEDLSDLLYAHVILSFVITPG